MTITLLLDINNGLILSWFVSTIQSQYNTLHTVTITLPIYLSWLVTAIPVRYRYNANSWAQTELTSSDFYNTTIVISSYQQPSGGATINMQFCCLLIGY